MTSNRPANGMILLEQGSVRGIAWAVCEHPTLKSLNGYVRVPPGHPWRGRHYDEIRADVPGGLTFSDGEWFGFDIMHAGNLWPGMPPALMTREHRLEDALQGYGDVPVVWAMPDIIALAMGLAEQAAQAAKAKRVFPLNWLNRATSRKNNPPR